MKDEMKDRRSKTKAGDMLCNDHDAQMVIIRRYFDKLLCDIEEALANSDKRETGIRVQIVLNTLWKRANDMSRELKDLLKDDQAVDIDEICKRYAALLTHAGDIMMKLTADPMTLLSHLLAKLEKEGK